MYWNYCLGRKSVGPQAVPFVERLSLFRSVHCWRFHCIPHSVCAHSCLIVFLTE